MITITARNVNDALASGVGKMLGRATRTVTVRGRDVIELTEPVATVYERPCERVLFDERRDANPFFHLMESLWMLAGRRDVAWIARFLPSIADYSDDGTVFHGAYGDRLRLAFDHDQLTRAVELLRREPATRRAVLEIWDAAQDLDASSLDLPCNTHAYLLLRDDALHLTVCNRSNDLLWGLYGANAVQFSMLLEYVAGQAGVPVGIYTHVSNNVHVYPDTAAWRRVTAPPCMPGRRDDYRDLHLRTLPVVGENPEVWDDDLDVFMAAVDTGTAPPRGYANRWFAGVAWQVAEAHRLYRGGQLEAAVRKAEFIAARDWRTVCAEWLERRIVRRAERQDHAS